MNPQTFVNEVLFQVTPEWEIGAANQIAPAILQQAPPVNDPELQTYLEGLVSRLTSRSPGSAFSYRLTVVNSPAINAVTVPGQIFVYTGLLQFVETEAELAGVLAHELAHNYGHHSARALIKQWHAQNVANLIAGAVNPQGQVAQGITSLVANLGIGLFVRAYSRFEEKEADLYGTHILYSAGYNPTAMSQFNLRMYQHNPRQPVKFLSTHPPAPDRADYLTDYLEAFDLQQPLAVDSEAFKKIKQKFSPQQPAGGPSLGVLPPGEPEV
jgi:predicted Zn-dependent protease